MRHISFALTTEQFLAEEKFVTRRLGWWNLKPGDRLMGVERSRGLKLGERVVRLGEITILGTRRELLSKLTDKPLYGTVEMGLEGFPGLDPAEFVARFCKSHKDCTPASYVNRIEFTYVGQPRRQP